MVKGLEVFREHFRDYADRYVFIGGAACDIAMTGAGLAFRAAPSSASLSENPLAAFLGYTEEPPNVEINRYRYSFPGKVAQPAHIPAVHPPRSPAANRARVLLAGRTQHHHQPSSPFHLQFL
jgi:hypothetical protein